MVDVKRYTKLFFGEETGKKRYGLTQKKLADVASRKPLVSNAEVDFYPSSIAKSAAKC
jgi:hypothetical protein